MACADSHRPAARYRVASEQRCLWHAVFSRRLLGVSLPTCAVVGTVLTAINQGTLVVAGEFPAVLLWKVPLTYSVPFLVSTWSQLRALRIAGV